MPAFYRTARIPLPSGSELSDEQRAIIEEMIRGPRGTVQGPIRAVIHSPVLADRWQQFGEFLRYRSSLAPRHSELSILTTARCWDCQLEWLLHVPHALAAGVDEQTIERLRLGTDPELSDVADRAVFAFTVELLRDHIVGDDTYARTLEVFGVVGTVELTALVGYYSMVAMTLNAHHIPPPEDATAGVGLADVAQLWT